MEDKNNTNINKSQPLETSPLPDSYDVELRSEEVQEVMGNVPPWILRRGIIVLALFLLVLLVGSWFFKYPETVSANLTLTTDNPPATIVAKTTGKIEAIYVDDLDTIVAGTPLALIESTASLSDILYLESVLAQGLSAISSSKEFYIRNSYLKLGSLQNAWSSLQNQLEAYNNFIRLDYYPRKIEAIAREIEARESLYLSNKKQQEIIEKQHLLEKKAYDRVMSLKEKNFMAESEFEQATAKFLQSEITVNNMLASMEGLLIDKMKLEETLVDMEHKYVEERNLQNTALKSLVWQLQNEIASWKMNYLLISPVDGQVSFTEVWAVNQNVSGGQLVFTVVPSTSTMLVGKAKLPVNRSGKVKAGQQVHVSFDNFPENQFGMVRAVVKSKSLTPLPDGFYVLELSFPHGLKTSYGEQLPISQEMTANAKIITEDTRLLEQFFLPLKQMLRNQ